MVQLIKNKARLVIRGFNQNNGVNYFDTYSPMTKIVMIRTLIALAAIHDLVVHQMMLKQDVPGQEDDTSKHRVQ